VEQILQQADFSKYPDGLMPAIVQDARTRTVLMLGFMSRESLERTVSTKLVTFYSRSRKELWTKGETSGNVLHLQNILIDCDADTLLVQARPAGPVCHTGSDTCFAEDNTDADDSVGFLSHLQSVIQHRKEHPTAASYTAKLFDKGMNKIAQKVGEEAVELIIEAKDEDNRDLFLGEAADLLYHMIVLLVQKGCTLQDVMEVLESRHR